MKLNKIYHIRLGSEIIKTKSNENDFSHQIFLELSNVVEVDEVKYIGFSDDENIFARLSDTKFKQLLAIFKKYYRLTVEDITDKVISGEMQKIYPEVECLTPELFTDFRLENTSVDDLLDKINNTGINSLDNIDMSILSKLKI